ncbi:MAG: 4Fe-4S binding protein [Eubacteriales bacterium]|nr:4Fe-4S binding protein [Eubacteriales bacterium]
MTAKACLQLLRTVKDAAFATVDGAGRPQVRVIDVMLVEDEALYFCTARGKEFCEQLISGGYAAVTAMNKAFQTVRLSGPVEKLDEQKRWIDRIFEANPVMNGVYPGESRYILEPFCIRSGQLEFFDLGKSPIERAYFSIGTAAPAEKGYEITDACVGCGRCAKQCPQQCIDVGKPYKIRQSHCLHCGLCGESCPVRAVVRRGARTC